MAEYVRWDEIVRIDGPVPPGLVFGDWSVQYPALIEYLTLTQWENGKPRQTATLMLFVEDGRVKLRFCDRAKARTLWMSSESLDSLLEALERHLRDGTGDWRKDRPWNPGNGRK